MNIRSLWPLWQSLIPPPREATVGWRPFLGFSLALNYAVSGLRVWSYHVLNLLIHIGAALTLFGLVRRTLLLPQLVEKYHTRAFWIAAAVGLIFVTHPLQTESVTYIIQRAESMMGLFFLMTLYAVLRAATAGKGQLFWYGLAVLACCLGMGSKQVMLTAPFIVLAYDRIFLCGSWSKVWKQRGMLYVLFCLSTSIVAIAGSIAPVIASYGYRSQDLTAFKYAQTQAGIIWYYLRLVFVPAPLVLDYGWPVAKGLSDWLLPGLGILGLLGLTVWALCRHSKLGFLGLCFFLPLGITSSFFPLITEIMAEHRMYLSLAPVIILTVLGGDQGARRLGRWQGGLVAILIFGVSSMLAYLTFDRNKDYRSEVVIWQDTIAKRPENYRAYGNLANVTRAAGNAEKAIVLYEQALVLNPKGAKTFNNLGTLLAAVDRDDEALENYRQAIKLRPNFAPAHTNIGGAYSKRGQYQEALQYYRKALEVDPFYAKGHYFLARNYMAMNDLKRAEAHFREALVLNVDDAQAHRDLGVLLAMQGRKAESLSHLSQATELNPADDLAFTNLGHLYYELERLDESRQAYRRAVELNPDNQMAQENLRVLLDRPTGPT